MGLILTKFKGKTIDDQICLGFKLLFLLQISCIVFFNLTQLQYHVGSDGSCNYLKALEIAKQGTLFVDSWVDQTTLYFDSPILLAAIYYKCMGNIFIAYGLANLTNIFFILVILSAILNSFHLTKIMKAISFNLLICPFNCPDFAVDDLGYSGCMLWDAQFYSVRILAILMLVKVIIDLEDNKKNIAFIIVTEILLLLLSVSNGLFMFVAIIVPLLVFYVAEVCYFDSLKVIFNYKGLVFLLSAGVTLSGKLIQRFIFHFTSRENDLMLVSQEFFWDNFKAVLLGWFDIFGGVSSNSCQAISYRGISCLTGIAIALFALLCLILVAYKTIKSFDNNTKYMFLLSIMFVNMAVFLLIDTRYSGIEIFPSRYYIIFFILSLPCMAVFENMIKEKILVRRGVYLLLFGVLLLRNGLDDRVYFRTRINYEALSEIADKMKELDIPVVYVYGNSLKPDWRTLRVIDHNRVYKYIYDDGFNATMHWGDYTYYDDVAEVQGKNVLITKEENFEQLPGYIKSQYCSIAAIYNGSKIYYAENNKFDLVSGITGNYSVDFPTSRDIMLSKGEINEEGHFVSDGNAGVIIEGPYTGINKGIYDFIVNYEMLDSREKTADFAVAINSGNDILAQIELEKGRRKAVLENIPVDNDSVGFEYQIYNYEGTKIEIISFEIIQKSGDINYEK